MAVFVAGLIPPVPPGGSDPVIEIRTIIAANEYIKQGIDAEVSAKRPQTEQEWATARGEAIKNAMIKNNLFKREVNAKVPGTI
jgi:hypothetical protein